MKKWTIKGAAVLSPDNEIEQGSILIQDDTIEKVTKETIKSQLSVIVEEGVIVPGLINSHDHLLGTYFPKVGNGPYDNWLPWDNDLKSSDVYQERQQIENMDLYLLGAYRNLVSGVTTVADHIPRFVGDQFYDRLPIKAVRDYGVAHSMGSFALKWGDEVRVEYEKAVKNDAPFITHISEGFDQETVNSIETLDKQGGLGDHSVLVHGIALSESDMKKIKKCGATIVWCGDSNMFMYNETADVKKLMEMSINVSIGTDSPMSGGLHLLHEIKFNKDTYVEIYGEELPDDIIFKMITSNAAKAFRMKKNGSIRKGNIADLTVVKHNGSSYVNSVINAELSDIMLVIIDGKPVYGDADFADLFKSLGVKYQNVVLDGSDKIIIGDPLGLLQRISRSVGFKKEFPFLPLEFEV